MIYSVSVVRKKTVFCVLGILCAFCIVFFIYLSWNTASAQIVLTDVTVTSKWVEPGENETYFVSIQLADPEHSVYAAHFNRARTVSLRTRDYYDMIRIGDTYPMMVLNVYIPFFDGRFDGLLDKQGNILMDKILSSDDLLYQYGTIWQI